MIWRNVDVERKARLSEGGRVSRRTVVAADGAMHDMGLMLPGLYRHTSPEGESLEILQGRCRIRRVDEGDWHELESGARFVCAPQVTYEIEVSEPLDFVASPLSRG